MFSFIPQGAGRRALRNTLLLLGIACLLVHSTSSTPQNPLHDCVFWVGFRKIHHLISAECLLPDQIFRQNNNMQTGFPPLKFLSKDGNAKSGGNTAFLSGNSISCEGTFTVPEEFSLGCPDDVLMQLIKPYLEGCPIDICFLLIRKP